MTIYELTCSFTTEASKVNIFDVNSCDRVYQTEEWSDFLALSNVDEAEVMSLDINVIKGTLGYSLDIYIEDAYEYFDSVDDENDCDEDTNTFFEEWTEEDWDELFRAFED